MEQLQEMPWWRVGDSICHRSLTRILAEGKLAVHVTFPQQEKVTGNPRAQALKEGKSYVTVRFIVLHTTE